MFWSHRTIEFEHKLWYGSYTLYMKRQLIATPKKVDTLDISSLKDLSMSIVVYKSLKIYLTLDEMSWLPVTNTSYDIFLTKIILDYETNYSCIAHNDELAIIITNNHAKFGYTKIITKHQFIVVIITTIIILNETRFYWHILKSKYALSMAKYIYMYSHTNRELRSPGLLNFIFLL